MDLSETAVRIRDYRPGDLQRLYQIDQICFAPDIAYSRSELFFYLRHKDSLAKIAEWNDDIAGFVVGRVEANRCAHVLTVDVIRDARRRRVGTALMNVLHEEFHKREIAMVFLEVDVSNRGALDFYERLGYERTETLKGYYAGRSDAYRMVLFMEKPPE